MAVHRLKSEDDDPEWPPDDFTGEWIVEWPNGQICVRSVYLRGKPEGDWLCGWPNGQVAQRGRNSNGQAIGTWVDYREDGTKLKEVDYRGPRTFQTRFYWPNGALKSVTDRVDGKVVSKKHFPAT